MARSSSDSRDAIENVDQQLQLMSARLSLHLYRLGEQREKCTTETERKTLDQLRLEAKRQAAAVTKLQESVEDTLAVMAKSSQALDDSAVSAVDANEILFHVVTVPFLKRHCPRQQSRSVDLKDKLRLLSRAKAMARQTISSKKVPRKDSASIREPLSSITSTESELPAPATDDQLMSPEEDIASISSSEASEMASSSSTTTLSPRTSVSVRDESLILTPPEGKTAPPPLPRKSSRRASYTPRVPSPSLMPSLPPMPTTRPPSVPESVESAESSPSSAGNSGAQSILSNLEKRFSLTMTTPPTTP